MERIYTRMRMRFVELRSFASWPPAWIMMVVEEEEEEEEEERKLEK